MKTTVEKYLGFELPSEEWDGYDSCDEEICFAIGKVTMNFQRLDDVLSFCIIKMLDVAIDKGKIIVAELSFTNKINLFSSLFHLLKNKQKFNSKDFELESYFNELIKALNRCQEYRNQIIHSTFVVNFKTEFKTVKQKITAKQKKGLYEISEEIKIDSVLHIADYIIFISMELREFLMSFKSKIIKAENYFDELEMVFKYRV